jgi:hypothetical protein
VTPSRPRRAAAAAAATPDATPDDAALDAATTARTAVAATHAARLHLPGGITEDVGFLDDEGEPLIVLCGNATELRGAACLSVEAGPQRRVVLGGTLHPVSPAVRDLSEVLGSHAPCFAESLQAGPVQVVQLAVDEIRVEHGCVSSFVSCAAYAVAEPDLWGAFAPTVAHHLDTDHGDVLAQLARLHLPGQRVAAAAIARLRPDALTLDVIIPEGAVRLELAMYARVDDPHELCGRLLEVAAPRSVHDRHSEDR